MKSVNQDGKINNLMTKLTAFITGTSYEQLPEEMVELAKRAVIDTVGVALAGWNETAVEKAKKVYVSQVSEQGGVSSLWGEPVKTDCDKAAIINGTASHVLDYDDASVGVVIHPSAPILSAITPLAEKLKSSGKEVITAYSIGTEVMIRIGQVMGIRHYHLGWHATDTLGTIGAAASSSYLLHLNDEQCSHALAIAASMTGGLQKNFGSMTKSLHVGLSASHGIQAALLAQQGFTGNTDIFGKRGFFMAFSGGADEEETQKTMDSILFGQPYDMLEGLSFKKFPCCFGTHRFIQGALDLKEEHQLSLEDVEEIVLQAQPKSLLPLVHSRPITGLQGKFSAEYTVLAAIADGYVKLSSFEDNQVLRADIQKLLPAVKLLELQESELDKQLNRRLAVEIRIKTKNGQVYEKTVQHAPGSKEKPLSEAEHRGKWNSCLSHYAQSLKHGSMGVIAHELYDQGLRIDSYTCFSDWMNEIYKQLYDYKPTKQMI
ncbi:MmgE/PrpD family protein [Bacillus benzoevorans]|uniref:2-methylcitrate dehydratase PrpD n=1 Tax=Bacillus benzoevorans TaxID=1456 RepID=A0A7X0LU26_9BACI|nr:MmgE/PrpD family protein [Bacillus benzoevorans]MBB6444506.1 2-methylcitrate dehydratase PrpD [Bacillus benzoevorans]